MEKTLTFTVTDALMSPLGLAVLTGAGFAEEDAVKHIHVSYDVAVNENGIGRIKAKDLAAELGLSTKATVNVCKDETLKPYGLILDNNGAIKGWVDTVEFLNDEDPVLDNIIAISGDQMLEVQAIEGANSTVKVDFYVMMTTGATEITIKPDDFGGNFYVEADTLYRNQDGKDMAATLTFPKVKIQSAFTLAMAPTGDPSTFDFVMDAMPGYTYFDRTNKVVCDITIVSGEADDTVEVKHDDPVDHHITDDEPVKVFKAVKKLGTAPDDVNRTESQANQDAISIKKEGNTYKVTKTGDLNSFASTAGQGTKDWIGILIETNDVLTNVTWNGTPLTQSDIDESASINENDHTIIFWTGYSDLPKTVRIGTVDNSLEAVTVKFVAAE